MKKRKNVPFHTSRAPLPLATVPLAIVLGLATGIVARDAWGEEFRCDGTPPILTNPTANNDYYNDRGLYDTRTNKSRYVAENAVRCGGNPTTPTKNSVAIGQQSGPFPYGTVTDKPEDGENAVGIGFDARLYTHNNDEGVGAAATFEYANTKNTVAIGNRSHTHAANAVAIGSSTDATGTGAVAIGTGTLHSSSHEGTRAAGAGSIALGDRATAISIAPHDSDQGQRTGRDPNVTNAIALGTESWAQAANAVAIGGGTGISAIVKGTSEVPVISGVGARVQKGADAGVALGGSGAGLDAARVTVAGGVAAGAGSVANREAETTTGRTGYDMLTGGPYAAGNGDPVWQSTMAAYSVGCDGGADCTNGKITRQVTGVAAGSALTDLVNVAQLKRAQEALDNHHFNIAANGKGAGVYGNDTVFFVGDDNIMVDLNGQTISIRLNPDLTVDSITIDNGGPVMNADGIDMADTPITNLADGADPHDAVNKGQLDGVDDRIRAGIAGAVAQANIPQVMTPGKFMVGMGAGHFRDQTSLGVGWSARSDNGRWVLRNSVGLHEDAMSVGGGIGYEF